VFSAFRDTYDPSNLSHLPRAERYAVTASLRLAGFAIHSAAHNRYQDAVLSTGLPAGTPQEALDTACTVHLAGIGHELGP
jgi:hypothetical protein